MKRYQGMKVIMDLNNLEISGLHDLSRQSERKDRGKLHVQTLRIGYRVVPKSVMANKRE